MALEIVKKPGDYRAGAFSYTAADPSSFVDWTGMEKH